MVSYYWVDSRTDLVKGVNYRPLFQVCPLFFVNLEPLTTITMDKNTIGYTHVFTWEQFQRALHYTKKYYGMDAPYFYRTAEAELEGRGQLIAIYNRFIYDDFRERLLFSDKSASEYMEQIPNAIL